MNAILKGVVQIRGSANIDDFQFYKFELKGEGTSDKWSTIVTYDAPVTDGLLGDWDTSILPTGSYWFRLVVVRKDGNYKLYEVPVTVVH